MSPQQSSSFSSPDQTEWRETERRVREIKNKKKGLEGEFGVRLVRYRKGEKNISFLAMLLAVKYRTMLLKRQVNKELC